MSETDPALLQTANNMAERHMAEKLEAECVLCPPDIDAHPFSQHLGRVTSISRAVPLIHNSEVYLDPNDPEGSTFVVRSVRITDNLTNHIDGEQVIMLAVGLGRTVPKGGKPNG